MEILEPSSADHMGENSRYLAIQLKPAHRLETPVERKWNINMDAQQEF